MVPFQKQFHPKTLILNPKQFHLSRRLEQQQGGGWTKEGKAGRRRVREGSLQAHLGHREVEPLEVVLVVEYPAQKRVALDLFG